MAATQSDPRRFHQEHEHLASPFGGGGFGKVAEAIARFFGTPQYLIGQSAIVFLWILLNALTFLKVGFDPYPFILLNLAFSLQAAYAAPLILLAQTRQAERDKTWSDADARHREELASTTLTLLQQNTQITKEIQALSEQVSTLTKEIHQHIVQSAPRTVADASGTPGAPA